MTETNQDTQAMSNADLWVRGFVRLIVVGAIIAVPVFWGAGTLDWTAGWVFIALLLVTFGVNLVVGIIKNPELMRERWKQQKGTKPFDKVFGLFYLLSVVALLVLSGLDAVRYEWTAMPPSLLYLGLALHCLGLVPVQWAMLTNPHLETTVRIQEDRGHRVISDGPYRLVRHPMYTGILIMFLGWPLVLGSWVSMAAVGALIVLFFIRTALEDKTLQNELKGYSDFCTKTRYRLVPGLW